MLSLLSFFLSYLSAFALASPPTCSEVKSLYRSSSCCSDSKGESVEGLALSNRSGCVSKPPYKGNTALSSSNQSFSKEFSPRSSSGSSSALGLYIESLFEPSSSSSPSPPSTPGQALFGQAGESGSGTVVYSEGTDLSGVTLTENVTNTIYSRRVWEGVTLNGIGVEGSLFHQSELEDVKVVGSTLKGVSLSSSYLKDLKVEPGSNFVGIVMDSARMEGADVDGLEVAGMDGSQILIRSSTLSSVNVYGAYLPLLSLDSSSVTSSKWYGVDMTGSEVYNGTLTDVEWVGIDGSGISFSQGSSLERVKVIGALLSGMRVHSGTKVKDSSLVGVYAPLSTYDGAVMTPGLKVSGSEMVRSSFVGTDLSGSVFEGTDLSHSSFKGASFRGSTLDGITADHADAEGADLSFTTISGGSARYANFRNANLTGANVSGMDLFGSDLTGAILDGIVTVGVNLPAPPEEECD